ncbi:MAG: sugar transferase [Chloroflexi bacterium]|nr:sugar transferase [Chloroflexota bacterium]
MLNKPFQRALKRFLDMVVSGMALLLLSPVLIVVAIIIRIRMGSPVIFKQVRPGKNKKNFTLYKFRTMNDKKDGDILLSDSERLTALGKIIRRFSLDEMPQLWNVLKGDMSLVGPRPLLQQYLPYYTEEECLRFTVPPGITGWAQINGRNTLSWDDRLKHDVWYVKNLSFWLDIRIILLTVLKVLTSKGIAFDGVYGMLNLEDERRQGERWDKGTKNVGE